MKKLWFAGAMALLLVFLLASPVLGMYYAYIYIKETAGNAYTNVPLMVTANVSQLAAGQFISSTGLDTRVLTGDGYAQTHMLADDKILFVTDLAAHEDKTLIFYTGAASLSHFPIIVGQGGNITTPDHADLEPDWVFQMLASGHFDTSAGANKNILHKQDAFRAWISDTDTLRVAALEAGGGEQWALEWDNFTSGHHYVYAMTDGLAARLYVDDFVTAKDTANLFDTNTVQTHGSTNRYDSRCFYAAGRWWMVYYYDATSFRYITSTDGNVWSSETSIAINDAAGGEEIRNSGTYDAKFRDGYMHITYSSDYADGSDRLMYRRGAPQSDGTIIWCAAWQTVMTYGTSGGYAFGTPRIAIDSDGYPTIQFGWMRNWSTRQYIQSSSKNDGTWGATTEWQIFSTYHQGTEIMHFPNSNKLAVITTARTSGNAYEHTAFRFYNGVSWEPEVDISSYVGDYHGTGQGVSMTADENDNLFVGWAHSTNYVAIYSLAGVWQRVTLNTVSSSYYGRVRVAYNEVSKVVYLLYGTTTGTNYVLVATIDTVDWELSSPVALTPLIGQRIGQGTPAYGSHIGFTMYDTHTYHSYLDLSQYVWNDNANDWYWMQNDVMPYANAFQLGVDGVWQLEYQPQTIVQGTTLPDVSATGSSHPGTIAWGSNPDGIQVSISGLMTDQDQQQYDYTPHIDMGAQDIIRPEPAPLTTDVDMTKLERNPFRPLALVISSSAGVTERLAWLGMGWFALILSMLAVHLGLGARQGEQPMHFILTTLTGMGMAIMFYVTGVFPLWPVILLAFGFIASIVYERMPTL